MERGIGKIITFVKLLNCASKIFKKIILKPALVISKRLELPYDDRTDNFIAPLRT